MGVSALQENGITKKILYLFQEKTLTPKYHPLTKVRNSRIVLFVGAQIIGFAAAFAVTQTVGTFHSKLLRFYTNLFSAAIVFPVVILLLLPVRTHLVPRLPFTRDELAILDRPTASPFVSGAFPLSIIA